MEGLTYEADTSLVAGQIVMVPLGRRKVPGVVVKKVARPNFETKRILQILYSEPLPRQLLFAVDFIHKYYLAASGEGVNLVLPRGVWRKRKRGRGEDFRCVSCGHAPGRSGQVLKVRRTHSESLHPSTHSLYAKTQLNEAQKNALRGIQEAPGATKLLFGVTGSGKTNVYLEMARKALEGQKSTVLLVPEIALTGQLVRVFREVFGDSVVLIHSKQTEAERHLIFDSLLLSDEPRVVVGPRSALFAPLKDLGLIIIDEEHETTYYQENPPRYSAIRMASMMANKLKIPLILGSATPTVEDFYLAKQKGAMVELSEKAKNTAMRPDFKIIDFKDRDKFLKNRYFSDDLLAAIERNLKMGRQTLIFHNRRGSSTMTVCENCGEEVLCPNCYLPLTLHADEFKLVCHTCGHNQNVPLSCPKCGKAGLLHKGFGTKLLESELKKLFKKAKVARFDADNKKGEGLEAVYSEVKAGEIDIIVGTQTVTKGLDLPKLATVGVVQADAGLSLPDYAAEEKVFQLLTQVMGRVGRGHIDTAEVFIQTYRPEHPVIKFAVDEDYLGFYEHAIRERNRAGFPPFRFLMKVSITLKTEKLVLKKIQDLARRLAEDKRLSVSPPQPAFHERTERGFTWQIVVRSRSRKALVEACQGLGKNFKISLDLPSLL